MMVTMVLGKYVQEMVNSLCMITKSILPMVKLPSVGRSRSYEAPSGASGVQDLPPLNTSRPETTGLNHE